jgi:lipoprotein-anchoring transpeptidase ErfK/SrfK
MNIRVLIGPNIILRAACVSSLLIAIILTLPILLYKDRFFPHTYIGKMSIGSKRFTDVYSQLSHADIPFIIISEGRTYNVSLRDIGIGIDPDASLDILTNQRPSTLPGFIQTFYRSLFTSQTITPVLYPTDAYFRFTERLMYHPVEYTNNIRMDDAKKQVILGTSDTVQTIDADRLLGMITTDFASSIPISAPVTDMLTPQAHTIESVNAKLISVFSKPVKVTLSDPKKTNEPTIEIPGSTVSSITSVAIDPNTLSVAFSMRPDLLSSVITQMSRQSRIAMTLESVGYQLERALTKLIQDRYDGLDVDHVLIAVNTRPNTNGERAKKYIEVDISDQRMYLFSDAKMIDMFRVSSGKDFPTPAGTFYIFNKAVNAYSNIYHVYMPYWMGFYMEPTLHASLGIHELPYFYSADGKQMQRPQNFIGEPNTGGCIALEPGVSKRVYEFADIGTPVVIFE